MKRKNQTPAKKKTQASSLEAFSWLLKKPFKIKIPHRVIQHLKVLGFLSLWFAIPFFLLLILVSPVQKRPEIFQAEESATPSALPQVDIYFKLKLRGVQKKNIVNQPIFVKADNDQHQLNFTFNPAPCWQDENDPQLFRGKLTLSEENLLPGWTFWIKGPVHLQRKFEAVALDAGKELDFTSKPLLPGDLSLPEVGQDDRVDESDRDYLWSLVAKDGSQPSSQEIKRADLDLDAAITGRDYSLLIDTGIGVEGEK